MHKRVFGDARNAAPNAEVVGCTGEFADLPERLHLTMNRSGALAGFRFACYQAVGLQAIDSDVD